MTFPIEFGPYYQGTFTIEIRTVPENVLVATVLETDCYDTACEHLARIKIDYAMSLIEDFTADIVRKESKNDD